MKQVGRYWEIDELLPLLLRDMPFYRNSGGGVTLSGGEPTLVMDFAAEVARELTARGIPVLLETCGDFDWDRFQEKLLSHLDQIYVDLKLVDRETHLRYTKRDNDRILANLARLIAQTSVPVLVRTPLIPGITMDPANLVAIARWLSDHGRSRIALLPYNPLWLAKATGLGKALAYDRAVWMTPEERAAVKKIFSGFELEREI
jgi:pyruvate formate lyase activating enzyme